MKKIAILLDFLFIAAGMVAQNVGIGTTTPAQRLHLVGDFRQDDGTVTLNNPGSIIRFQNAGVNKTYMQLSGDDLRMGTFGGNQFGRAIFRMAGADRVFIDSTGNVQVIGLQDASLSSPGYLTLGSITGRNLILDNNEIMVRDNGGPDDLILQFDGGNVGVGISSPTDKLHVSGNIRTTGTSFANTVNASSNISAGGNLVVSGTGLISGAISTNTSLTINDPSGIVWYQNAGVNKVFSQLSGDNYRFGTVSGNSDGEVILRMNGDDMINFRKTSLGGTFIQMKANGTAMGVLQASNTGTVSLTAVNPNTQVQLGGEVFIDNTAGRTGVGISNPQERLHVNGNMIVNGNAVVADGRITGNTTGSAYNLLPLAYGRVNDDGTRAGGTPNFTSERTGEGIYEVTVTGSSASSVITVTPGNLRVTRARYIGSGVFEIYMYEPDINGEYLNSRFHFIVYEP